MTTEDIKNQIIEKIVNKLKPAFIILFGSFSDGTYRDDSDIDLAYFSERNLSTYERFILSSQLAEIANREVDLIDIKQIDTIFAMQVFGNGELIYLKDENEYTRQTMRAYSMFVTLNEQRKPVIDAIKERESVYGNE